MAHRTLAAAVLFSVFFTTAAPLAAPGAETPPAVEKQAPDELAERTALGLRAWFEGRTDEAEGIFSGLVAENSTDPVPYHALAILLADRHDDYPRVTELYNRVSTLTFEHPQAHRDIQPLLDEYISKGCVQAQLMSAHIFGWGLAGAPQAVRAMLLLRRAADGGYAQAQQELAAVYGEGNVVERNVPEAIRLYSAAVAQGDAYAMKSLAVYRLSSPDSTPAQRAAARGMLRRAAEAGLPAAQMTLAEMYMKGIDVDKNPESARLWLERSAEGGSTESMVRLAFALENGLFGYKSTEEALKWHLAAAERGNSDAEFRLGVLYYTGEGVEEDHEEAYRRFMSAAEHGEQAAWYNVAWLSLTGDGTEKDINEAKKWFELSAASGNPDAQLNLAVMYANGEGVEKDLEEAYYWLELSRLCGNEAAPGYLQKLAGETPPEARDRASRRAQNAFRRIRARAPQANQDQ